MHNQILQQIGLSKNEAQIYETLLREGESTVGMIANKSKVHRRNVYDAIKRLIEKGIVFEVLETKENRYQAVNPNKLSELLEEKQSALQKVMPELEALFTRTPPAEAVYIYKGVDGWKNYIRDILRVGKDVYTIGGKGAWLDPRLSGTLHQFTTDITKKKMNLRILFDHEMKTQKTNFAKLVHISEFRFLPGQYSTPCAIDIFGDRVVVLSNVQIGSFNENSSFTVTVNQQIADAFLTWFQFMWENCESVKS